ncbi:MAG TPA: hypothetical protein VGR69_10990, partial [Candidatus Rubrimentiphilum sp.]|nr:hypothetical protein [Candidatus Rubrimentiphilum sp.]
PSLLEVYIDNILELRQDVPQGPFTVRDLPASAAHSDIVLVLTDINGKKTLQVARPSYDPDFLGKNQRAFSVDAGLAHEKVDLVGSYYHGSVFDGMFRYGISNRITGEIYGESINGENFADAGADMSLGEQETFTFRIGGGNKRHSSQYEYNLRSRKIRLREQLSFNSLKEEPFFGEDFGDTVSQISETTDLTYDMSRNLSFVARLDRRRSNNGSNSSAFSLRTRYRNRAITLELSPLYDFVSRRPSATLTLTFRASDDTRIVQRSAVTTRGQRSASLEFRKDSIDPSDPISYSARIAAGRSQDRRFFISDEMRWGTATFNYQNLNGTSIYEPQLEGALAFAGNRLYPVRTVGDNEAFGILHLPGLKHVRVSINSSDSGATDAHGDLALRDLQAFRDNVIDASTADLPIDVNVIEPLHVVPAANTPVFVVIPVLSRAGFTLNVFDERGMPLDPGGQLQGQNGTYPVGYNGRVYVTGVGPGTQTLTGTANGVACTLQITVPANIQTIPDLGRQTCRANAVPK